MRNWYEEWLENKQRRQEQHDYWLNNHARYFHGQIYKGKPRPDPRAEPPGGIIREEEMRDIVRNLAEFKNNQLIDHIRRMELAGWFDEHVQPELEPKGRWITLNGREQYVQEV